jgi:vitamin B12 transporter
MFHRNTLSAAILLALSHAAAAQEQEAELAPVVVTANRVARTADETLSSVTVITRKDIEEKQAQSLTDLLRDIPGIQFADNGGAGKSTSLYMRGTNDGHTLILVDGVRISSATSANSPIQDISLDQIERVEIVRGPRAALYGSDAIGGVIQIFTRKGSQPTTLSLGGGSRDTYSGSASTGIGSADQWLNVSSSGYSTHGINVGATANEGDADGYTRSTVNLRGGKRFGDQFDTDLQIMRTDGRNKYDGTPNVTDLREDIYAANLRYAATDNYTTSLKLAQSIYATSNYKDETFSSRFDTRRSQTSWQNDLTLAPGHQVVGGLDYQDDVVISSTKYSQTSRANTGAFAQYLADFKTFDMQFALRMDDNEQYGKHNTGSTAFGYTVSPALHLRASYGTAFKAPTFNDLYYPAPSAGNPDLKPEQSRSSELGASGKVGDLNWTSSLFRTHISNLIAWAPIATGSSTWIPSNVSNAEIKGAEWGATEKFGNTKLGFSATWVDPRDRSGSSTDGKILVRRAKQTARLDVDHAWGKWSFGSSLNGTGKRYDDAANATKLGGYATLDLRTEYRLNTNWRVQARVENTLDKRYQTASSYNEPGVGAYVTLRYQGL